MRGDVGTMKYIEVYENREMDDVFMLMLNVDIIINMWIFNFLLMILEMII